MSKCTKPMARCTVTRINNNVVTVRSSRVRAVAATTTSGCSCSSWKLVAKKDYYEVLSLEPSAAVGAAEIKRAYRRLALRHHPDLCPPSRRAESTELFLELRRAYETLSDPARRVRYDAQLRATTTTTMSGTGTTWREPSGTDAEFPRDVWEAQLRGLHARSEQRQKARTGRSD